ncbi:MAG: ATP-binding protein [Pseudomonadota bacterium]
MARREIDREPEDSLESGRVNFAKRILVWSSVTIALMATIIIGFLAFALGSEPERLIPVLVITLVFLTIPPLLRLGVPFRWVRFWFFAIGLGGIQILALHPTTGVMLGYISYLPIFILLSGIVYQTRGVLVIAALSLGIILGSTYFNAQNLPYVMNFATVPEMVTVTARHVSGVIFASVLVIVAMSMFRELLQKLRTARDREQALSVAKTEFLASMSHEVRTPLNAIIGMAEILRTRDLPVQEKRQVETIAEAGHALLDMLNQVLDASRLDARQMSISPEATDMPEFFEGFIRLWGPIAEQKGLAFRMEIEPEIPETLEVDELRLRQCINNLLSNALKFTDEGFILLSARWDVREGSPTRLLVEVTDTGIGMSPDASSRVFAPFEQGDESIERAYGGTGLGLSITRSLARLMGGDLSFKSVAGEGTIFTLTLLGIEADYNANAEDAALMPYALPRTDEEAEAADLAQHGSNTTALPLAASQFRVIVADDIATNRFIAVGYLRTLGVEAIEVENGADAVALVESDPSIDLVLLDRHMPDTDGIWALKQLKANPETRHVAVAIFTAGLSEQDKRHCLALGAIEVLIKPFTIATLRDLVDRLRQNREGACAES